MLASRQFGFMLVQGLATMFIQLGLLRSWCSNISQIYHTFTFRLGSYALIALIRTALGKGSLGRAIRTGRSNSKNKKGLWPWRRRRGQSADGGVMLDGLGAKVNGDSAAYEIVDVGQES